MTFKSVNPADGSTLKEVAVFTAAELESRTFRNQYRL